MSDSMGKLMIDALDRMGYYIMPKEPTEEMIDAGLSITSSWQDIPGSGLTVAREKMRRRYKAMVATHIKDGEKFADR